jgi:hypothetical protein
MISLVLCIAAVASLVMAVIIAMLVAVNPRIRRSEYDYVLVLAIMGFVFGLLSLSI